MKARGRIIVGIIKYVLSSGLKIYLDYCDPEYGYLVTLGKGTRDERTWAYFLAQELLMYRFYWWNKTKRQKVLSRIERLWLRDRSVEWGLRTRARNYIVKLGLPVENIRCPRTSMLPRPEEIISSGERLCEDKSSKDSGILLRCSGCINLHGQYYNGQLLVCAMHPYGKINCEDYTIW